MTPFHLTPAGAPATPVYLRACRDASCAAPTYFGPLLVPADGELIADDVDELRVQHGDDPEHARIFGADELAWKVVNRRRGLVTLAPITDWIATIHEHERERT